MQVLHMHKSVCFISFYMCVACHTGVRAWFDTVLVFVFAICVSHTCHMYVYDM